jgi:putative Holliday junction resolvase
MSGATGPATVLAFDFGARRIGVAIGDSALGIAHPLQTIDAAAREVRFRDIGRLIDEWQPTRLLVGLPLAEDGGEGDFTARCRRFARQLEGRYKLPVQMLDERYTSTAAESLLAAGGLDWRERRGRTDQHAACLLLQAYFDASAKSIV